MLTTYTVLKTLHVITVVVWVGGGILINILAARIQRANDHHSLARLAKEVEVIGKTIFLPASIIVLGLGIWMVVISSINFTDPWIIIGIVGIVATSITGSVVLGPRAGKVGQAIEERGAEDPGVQAQLAQLFTLARIDIVVLILIVANMVIKPGA